MNKITKYIGLASLSALLLVGCTPKDDPKPKDNVEVKKEEKLEAKDVLAKAEKAMLEVKSFHASEKYANNGEPTLEINGDIVVNEKSQMDMNVKIADIANDGSLQYISKDGYLYMSDTASPDEWMKMELSEEMINSFKIGTNLLLTKALNYGGTAEVVEKDGTYIVTINSKDDEKLKKELMDNQNILQLDAPQLEEVKSTITFKNVSYTAIVDKKTFNLLESTTDVAMVNKETNEEQTVSTSLTYAKHNEVEPFELPKATENAIDLSTALENVEETEE